MKAVRFRCDYTFRRPGWFKYHEIPLTFRDARMMCFFEGGVLASPNTLELKTIMRSFMCNVDIYTGMKALSMGHFYSIEGTPLSTTPYEWGDMEPDNKGNSERCISMTSAGKLADVRCDEPRPYICYRANTKVDVNACGTPDPEYRMDRRTKKCYKFHKKPRDFEGAHFACSAEGGHLAIINSQEEANIIKDLIDQNPADKIFGNFHKDYHYLGFVNWGKNPQTDWMTLEGQTLKQAGFSQFHGEEPNNFGGAENCGSVYRGSGLLNDLECKTMIFTFICEKDPDYPQVCERPKN
ncbi:C-type lectin domain-containing protein 161-like [Anticarsia gemmatalis]|uniref:C-type lectin domain-containing protein 161-like n=1 Tax=Anticarsia gemmatalis TaxID=129554 RepID=UPI003F7651D6